MLTIQTVNGSRYFHGPRQDILDTFDRVSPRTMTDTLTHVIGDTLCVLTQDARGDVVRLFLTPERAYLSVNPSPGYTIR